MSNNFIVKQNVRSKKLLKATMLCLTHNTFGVPAAQLIACPSSNFQDQENDQNVSSQQTRCSNFFRKISVGSLTRSIRSKIRKWTTNQRQSSCLTSAQETPLSTPDDVSQETPPVDLTLPSTSNSVQVVINHGPSNSTQHTITITHQINNDGSSSAFPTCEITQPDAHSVGSCSTAQNNQQGLTPSLNGRSIPRSASYSHTVPTPALNCEEPLLAGSSTRFLQKSVSDNIGKRRSAFSQTEISRPTASTISGIPRPIISTANGVTASGYTGRPRAVSSSSCC